jgi:hypothetical protein
VWGDLGYAEVKLKPEEAKLRSEELSERLRAELLINPGTVKFRSHRPEEDGVRGRRGAPPELERPDAASGPALEQGVCRFGVRWPSAAISLIWREFRVRTTVRSIKVQ